MLLWSRHDFSFFIAMTFHNMQVHLFQTEELIEHLKHQPVSSVGDSCWAHQVMREGVDGTSLVSLDRGSLDPN